MDTTTSATIVAIFDAYRAANPARPVITYYDDATGERTELSAATLHNWVAKTANLIVDGCGLGPSDVAVVRLPPHWQTAAILLGCWSAGLTVDLGGAGVTVGGAAVGGAAAGGMAFVSGVAFVSADQVAGTTADEIYALALAPLAVPFRPGPPAGSLDYVVEVRGHGDHFTPATPVRPQTIALGDRTRHSDLVAAGASRGLPPGARLLIDTARYADPADWLVAPLVAGASIVLCANLNPAALDARLTTEHALPYPGLV